MTKDEAGQIIAVLFSTYPSATLTKRNVDAYASFIVDLDARVAREAINRLSTTKTFLPSVSEIRSCAADIVLGPLRSGEEAYAILVRAVRVCGYPSPPKFRDANITRAIGVWGSWGEVCRSFDDDAAGRARFIELYEQGATRERADAIAGKALPGPARPVREFAPASWRQTPDPQPAAAAIEVVPRARVKAEPSPYAGQRMSAEQIEAALGGAK